MFLRYVYFRVITLTQLFTSHKLLDYFLCYVVLFCLMLSNTWGLRMIFNLLYFVVDI